MLRTFDEIYAESDLCVDIVKVNITADIDCTSRKVRVFKSEIKLMMDLISCLGLCID